MKTLLKMAAAAAALCASTSAIAGPNTFDPTTGTGYFNKGTIQSTLGMNNPQLQAAAQSGGIVFAFEVTERWQAVCTWITTDGKDIPRIHNFRTKRKYDISTTVDWTGRNNSSGINGPLTGFILTGLGGPGTTSDPVPQVGQPCVGGDEASPHDGTYSSVTLLGTEGGELTVNGIHIWP